MNAHTLRISSQGSHRIPSKNDIGRELVRTYTCPSVQHDSIEMQATRPLMSSCCTICHSTTMLSVICKQICAWACCFVRATDCTGSWHQW